MTFVTNTILGYLMAKENNILALDTSIVDSQLLSCKTIANSALKIPIPRIEENACQILAKSSPTHYIRQITSFMG